MPLDARMILMGQPAQINDPLDSFVKAQSLQDSRMNNRLNQRRIQAKDREDARVNVLQGLMSQSVGADGKFNHEDFKNRALAAGFFDEASTVAKQQSSDAQEQRLTTTAHIDDGLKKIQIGAQIMQGATDQQGYSARRQKLGEVLGAESMNNMPEQYTPEGYQMIMDSALSYKDKIESQKFDYQQQNDAANRDVTLRGQDVNSLNNQMNYDQRERTNNIMALQKTDELNQKHTQREIDRNDAIGNLNSTISQYEKLQELQGKTPTGAIVGSSPAVAVRAAIPGEDSDNIQKLRAGYNNLAIKALGAFKAGGATFGALSEKEGTWVKQTQAALDNGEEVNKELLDEGLQLLNDRKDRIPDDGGYIYRINPDTGKRQKMKVQ